MENVNFEESSQNVSLFVCSGDFMSKKFFKTLCSGMEN